MNCLLCPFPADKDLLCQRHSKEYLWDESILGFRRKKRNFGSRYSQDKYHQHETKLIKILERYFGPKDIITSFRPIWALSNKGILYEYDIFIKSQKTLIEYQGKQHYRFSSFFHQDREDFLAQKERDVEKVRLAKLVKFKLTLFKYTEPLFEDYVINKILKE